ncbi:MAG TPA: hypothetical protein VFU02_15975 [Polyangiaceae bacterium]|nr:hypothetical protein [Polyangiaceae bacterium]
MHRSEAEQCAACIACAADVSSQDRTYACGEDQVLCYACAIARKWVYDEANDRWVIIPDVADLFGPNAQPN